MTTCKACDAGNDWLAFNWKAAIDGETKDLAAMAKALQYICEAKTGELYACTICKGQWFLTDGNMYPISPEKITIFTDWCRKNRCPTAEQHNLLASVVGTNFRNGKDICIPVKVTHEDGTVHEQAIVVVTKNPPTGIVDRQNELLGSEKMQFEPTRYALPLSVRRASANAKDFGGGAYPTGIASGKGAVYYLDGYTNLFKHDGLTGNQMSLSSAPYDPLGTSLVLENGDDIVHIYYDHYANETMLC